MFHVSTTAASEFLLSDLAGDTRRFVTDGLRVEDADADWLTGDTTKRKQGTMTRYWCPVDYRKSISNDDGYYIVIVIVGHVTIDAVSQIMTKVILKIIIGSFLSAIHLNINITQFSLISSDVNPCPCP